MSIVLNEYKWAENAISEKDLGKSPMETLGRVAKYYVYNGKSKKETRELLNTFLLECDPRATSNSWSSALDKVVRSADKYPLVMIDSIAITKPEMEIIQGIDGKQTRRLAFTLLCVAKYKKAVMDKNEYWVNTPDKDIMRMANINTSIKRQSLMFGQLYDLGLIKFSKKVDNTSVQVIFAKDGEEAMRVYDFRNLGYQYMNYCGGRYFLCQCCGIMEKYSDDDRGRRRKYCDSCASKIRIMQTINSVNHSRNTVKLLNV